MAARTSITVQSLDEHNGQTLTDVAVDDTNGMQFINTGREVVIVRAPTTSDSVTIVIEGESAGRVDPIGRPVPDSGDAVVGVSGGLDKVFGPFDPRLFNDPSGHVLLDFSSLAGSPRIAAVIIPRPA